MDGTSTAKSKILGVIVMLLILIGVTIVTPSSWLGGTKNLGLFSVNRQAPKVVRKPTLTIKDANSDGQISWSEVVSSSLIDSTSTLNTIKDNPIDQKAIAELNDPNNLTGEFSKNLFLATTQLRESGVTDEIAKQKTIAYLMEQEASKIKPTTYTLNDLQIDTVESKSSIKAYGNAIAPLVKNIIVKDTIVSDLTSLTAYAQSLNVADLSPIVKNKSRIDDLIKKLLAVRVPISATSYHLLMLNRLAYYDDTLAAFSNIDSDPVRATILFNSYQTTMLLLAKIPSRLTEYFNIQNIVFGQNEAGYIFTGGL